MLRFGEKIQINRDGLAATGEVIEVLFPALSAVTAFCGALWGEEVILINLGATKKFTEASLSATMEEDSMVG